MPLQGVEVIQPLLTVILIPWQRASCAVQTLQKPWERVFHTEIWIPLRLRLQVRDSCLEEPRTCQLFTYRRELCEGPSPSTCQRILGCLGKDAVSASGCVGAPKCRGVGITLQPYTDLYQSPIKQEATWKANSFPDFVQKVFLKFETKLSMFYRKFCCPPALIAFFTAKLHDTLSENKMGTIDICLLCLPMCTLWG